MTKHEIILANLDAWKAFATENRDAIESDYGSTANAYQHAINGGLTLGGGAAHFFIVRFAE